ncbi:MAG: GHKL domain-containing protein [Clostridiales bacterium]|jgi:hypothetical protein|nr:GHKL domain-containing protein [Clostridiales bacterium]
MGLADLVRILGILMDNAIEECMTLTLSGWSLASLAASPNVPVITVKLTRNDEMVSCTVRNAVSPERKEKGVKAGVSSKGVGRGKGLMIVRGILEKYDCVTLNSYFQEDCFVQNLVIINPNRGACKNGFHPLLCWRKTPNQEVCGIKRRFQQRGGASGSGSNRFRGYGYSPRSGEASRIITLINRKRATAMDRS